MDVSPDQMWEFLIYISAMISFLIFYVFFKDRKTYLLKSIPRYAFLWFDYLKWLLLIGAITFVAEQTNNVVLLTIMGTSYLIIYIYVLIKFLNIINSNYNNYINFFNPAQISKLAGRISSLGLSKDIAEDLSWKWWWFFVFYLPQWVSIFIYIVAILLIMILYIFYDTVHSTVLLLQQNSTT